ncbi:hypothetical protein ACVMGC_004808 [Bradyrhizobium barranii subsp. barranii]
MAGSRLVGGAFGIFGLFDDGREGLVGAFVIVGCSFSRCSFMRLTLPMIALRDRCNATPMTDAELPAHHIVRSNVTSPESHVDVA